MGQGVVEMYMDVRWNWGGSGPGVLWSCGLLSPYYILDIAVFLLFVWGEEWRKGRAGWGRAFPGLLLT